MLKASGCHLLLFLVVLLSRQVSGTFQPLALKTPVTSKRASDPIGSRREHQFDASGNNDSASLATIHAIRGGNVGSIVSSFNDYIGESKARSWAILAFSILADMVSVTLMKTGQDEGSAHKIALSFFGFAVSLAGFGLALKSIDVSIAYAIWASVGTALVSIIGIVFFGESLDMKKIICLSMILLGVVGLELSEGH